MAPMRMKPASSVIPLRPGTRPKSTSRSGVARRSFIIGMRLMPPARILASPPESRASASLRLAGVAYSKFCGIITDLVGRTPLGKASAAGKCRHRRLPPRSAASPLAGLPALSTPKKPAEEPAADQVVRPTVYYSCLPSRGDDLPNLFRRQRHIEMPYAERAQRVDHRIDY